MSKPKNILIVGMPRSGTSLTASIFSDQGYFLAEDSGKELRSGDEFNPAGYFEAAPLIEANAKIFEMAGFPHDNTWLFDRIDQQAADRINSLEPLVEHRELVEKYQQNRPWAWKDPRLCYTLGYWWKLVEKNSTVVLLLIRTKEDIYNSFLRMKWRIPGKEAKKDTYLRVDQHIVAARKALELFNIPYFEVNYTDYNTDPIAVCQKINEATALNLKPEHLNFSRELDHGNLKGRIGSYIDVVATHMPAPLRKCIKWLTPKTFVRYFFPHRE